MNDEQHKAPQDELKDISPRLHSMAKKNPFGIPEGYFDELPMAVQKRISRRKHRPAEALLEWLNAHKWAPLATALLVGIIFSLSLFFWGEHAQGPQVAQNDRVSTQTDYPVDAIQEDQARQIASNMDVDTAGLVHNIARDLAADNKSGLLAYSEPRSMDSPMMSNPVGASINEELTDDEAAVLEEYILETYDDVSLTDLM